MFSPENSDILFLCNYTAGIPWNQKKRVFVPVEIFFSSSPNNVLIKSFKPLPKLRKTFYDKCDDEYDCDDDDKF